MGRGTILANLGEGQYTVKLDFGESRLAAQILLLTGANTDLDAQIAAQQVKVNQAQAAIDASNAALSAAINAYVAGNSSPNLLPAIETAKLDQVAKEEALRTETVAIGKLQSAKANNLRKIDDLNSYRASLTLNAWCADYTDTASGEVATLEIPNESQKVLIAPGGRLPVASDGELRMRALMTPEQAYYNAAILPGWQKFKPTYRSGTITAINGDTADVLLDEAKSSATDIADIGLATIEFDVNQTGTLTNVPIVYQDCGGDVFEVGDSVVVQFMSQNWSTPQIIGFLSNPKQCGKLEFVYFGTIQNKSLRYKWKFADFALTNAQWTNYTLFAAGNVLKKFTNGTSTIYLSYTKWPNISLTFQSITSFRVYTSYNKFIQSSPGLSGLTGVSAKYFDGKWYIFACLRGNTSYGFATNRQDMMRGELDIENNQIINWTVVHSQIFEGSLGLPNMATTPRDFGSFKESAGQRNPTNFNDSCTEAVTMLQATDITFDDINVGQKFLTYDTTQNGKNQGNACLLYTISGINVSGQIILPDGGCTLTNSISIVQTGETAIINGNLNYFYEVTFNASLGGNVVTAIDYVGDNQTKLITAISAAQTKKEKYRSTLAGQTTLNNLIFWQSISQGPNTISNNTNFGWFSKTFSNSNIGVSYQFWEPLPQISVHTETGYLGSNNFYINNSLEFSQNISGVLFQYDVARLAIGNSKRVAPNTVYWSYANGIYNVVVLNHTYERFRSNLTYIFAWFNVTGSTESMVFTKSNANVTRSQVLETVGGSFISGSNYRFSNLRIGL